MPHAVTDNMDNREGQVDGGEEERVGGKHNFCLGQEHDAWEVREREGSECPPDFQP